MTIGRELTTSRSRDRCEIVADRRSFPERRDLVSREVEHVVRLRESPCLDESATDGAIDVAMYAEHSSPGEAHLLAASDATPRGGECATESKATHNTETLFDPQLAVLALDARPLFQHGGVGSGASHVVP